MRQRYKRLTTQSTKIKTYDRRRLSLLAGVVLLTVIVGIGFILASSAQTATVSAEAENGTLASGATSIVNGAASGGSAIQFGAASPSGQAIPVGDITGWTQIYTQDFKTDAAVGSLNCLSSGCSLYGGTLGAYPNNYVDTSGNGQYNAGKTMSVSGGLLDIFLHTDTSGIHYVAAPKLTLPSTYDKTSARIAIRYKSTPIPGYKTAWLLYPDSGVWPRDGEIDFPEGNLDSTFSGFMHRQDATLGSDQQSFPSTGFTGDRSYANWHTAVIEWVAGTSLNLYLDGVLFGQATSRVPSTPMHYIIQSETQLSGGPPSNTSEGHISIDWVSVWKKAP